MPEYYVKAKVDRIVTSEVKLTVEAADEQEAMDKATKALAEYPEPVHTEGVNRIQLVSANHWIPRSVEFTAVTKGKNG